MGTRGSSGDAVDYAPAGSRLIIIANQAFAPTEDEISLAHRQIEAFDAAQRNGQGVAVVDGKIVENLHIVTAKAMLTKAQAIAAMAE